jgi:outer membrane immunogenic protein
MKKLALTAIAVLAATAASAADMRMPVKAPPPAPAPLIYSWSGLYIGGHVGGAKAERCLSIVEFNTEVCRDRTGWLGGGQVGYNFQTGAFVFGVEFSGSFAGLNGNSRTFPNFPNAWFHSDGKSLLLLTGRVGFAADRALFYITGGGAWSRNEVTLYYNGSSASRDVDRQGWTIGGGIEYAFTQNWSFAGQYNFVDLGGRDVTFNLLNLHGHTSNELHVFTARLNYRFGVGAPVVARY